MSANNCIIIRPAAKEDADEIYALELTCSKNPWTREGIVNELLNPSAIFLVLLSTYPENRIIGFICSSLVVDELQILEVAIHPDHRKRGYGAMLINGLLSAISDRNVSRVLLEARVSNRPAIGLYEKCGFVRDGIRKGYYRDGEDALLMSRETCN